MENTAEDRETVAALAGAIAPGGLCHVITCVADGGWRGELVVVSDDERRCLFFDQGHVVGAESDAEGDRVGDVLLRTGVLRSEQVTACRVLTESGSVRFGQAA